MLKSLDSIIIVDMYSQNVLPDRYLDGLHYPASVLGRVPSQLMANIKKWKS
jgi:hypothetical protein